MSQRFLSLDRFPLEAALSRSLFYLDIVGLNLTIAIAVGNFSSITTVWGVLAESLADYVDVVAVDSRGGSGGSSGSSRIQAERRRDHVAPFVAGGTVDQVAREVARGLEKAWGVPVLVDNKPGAGNILAATAIAHGQKLLFADLDQFKRLQDAAV
jgi:hypothetical protein